MLIFKVAILSLVVAGYALQDRSYDDVNWDNVYRIQNYDIPRIRPKRYSFKESRKDPEILQDRLEASEDSENSGVVEFYEEDPESWDSSPEFSRSYTNRDRKKRQGLNGYQESLRKLEEEYQRKIHQLKLEYGLLDPPKNSEPSSKKQSSKDQDQNSKCSDPKNCSVRSRIAKSSKDPAVQKRSREPRQDPWNPGFSPQNPSADPYLGNQQLAPPNFQNQFPKQDFINPQNFQDQFQQQYPTTTNPGQNYKNPVDPSHEPRYQNPSIPYQGSQNQQEGSGSYATSQNYQNYEKHEGMPYNFAWSVKDDQSYNDYGHQESSDGKLVSGSYYVLLPDGRTQIVTYKVEGDSGFVADVRYEGSPQTFSPGVSNPAGSDPTVQGLGAAANQYQNPGNFGPVAGQNYGGAQKSNFNPAGLNPVVPDSGSSTNQYQNPGSLGSGAGQNYGGIQDSNFDPAGSNANIPGPRSSTSQYQNPGSFGPGDRQNYGGVQNSNFGEQGSGSFANTGSNPTIPGLGSSTNHYQNSGNFGPGSRENYGVAQNSNFNSAGSNPVVPGLESFNNQYQNTGNFGPGTRENYGGIQNGNFNPVGSNSVLPGSGSANNQYQNPGTFSSGTGQNHGGFQNNNINGQGSGSFVNAGSNPTVPGLGASTNQYQNPGTFLPGTRENHGGVHNSKFDPAGLIPVVQGSGSVNNQYQNTGNFGPGTVQNHGGFQNNNFNGQGSGSGTEYDSVLGVADPQFGSTIPGTNVNHVTFSANNPGTGSALPGTDSATFNQQGFGYYSLPPAVRYPLSGGSSSSAPATGTGSVPGFQDSFFSSNRQQRQDSFQKKRTPRSKSKTKSKNPGRS